MTKADQLLVRAHKAERLTRQGNEVSWRVTMSFGTVLGVITHAMAGEATAIREAIARLEQLDRAVALRIQGVK